MEPNTPEPQCDSQSDQGESYGEQLFKYTFDEGRQEPRFLIFRGLQLMNIFNMQNDLAKLKHDIMTAKSAESHQTESLTKVMHNYSTSTPNSNHILRIQINTNHLSSANAIRDYEYLTRLTPITGSQARRGRLDLERVFGDDSYQFIDEGSGYRRFADGSLLPSDNLREILKRHLPRSVSYTKYDIRNRTDEYFSNEPPEQISPFVDRLARFLVAFLGGAMLVVPMMIMRLPEVTVVKSLVTVSISVLAFAGALSVFFKASNTDTMVATATYAAVLVVFIGVSG
ncbi:Ff.00g042220.m01.CDS01 [Fusarium sp. VM40]|nr:Ff.00g042220.m01.CDS01 [Fusarium sp. VM40]